MKSTMEDHLDLTKNQALVFGALTRAQGPLSAYTILDRLRGDGFRAPLQVYRALDTLRDLGLVHRLESLNAFVACRHLGCDAHGTTAFAICEGCGSVTEFAEEKITNPLKSWAKSDGFGLKTATIELRGLCQSCQAA